MPPAISQKGVRFLAYRSGYHVGAPALESLYVGKRISLSGIRPAAGSASFFNEISINSNHIILSVYTPQTQNSIDNVTLAQSDIKSTLRIYNSLYNEHSSTGAAKKQMEILISTYI